METALFRTDRRHVRPTGSRKGPFSFAPNRNGGRPARPARSEAPRVWQPKAQAVPQGSMSFEDMMSRFKSQSEEKIADLKRVTENRRGGGYSRKR